jgi:hypothetical protein
MEYRIVIHALDPSALRRLSATLSVRDDIAEFKLSPTGD